MPGALQARTSPSTGCRIGAMSPPPLLGPIRRGCRAELAKALLSRGRVEEARDFSRQAKEALTETKELWWEPEVLRVAGDVCLAEGDRAGAEAGYRKAIEVAQRQGAQTWERRAEASLAAMGG